MLLFLIVVLILIGLGLVLGVVACAAAGLMLSIGILTTSTLTGLATRRFTTAAQVAVIQVGAACGVIAGIGTATIGAWLWVPAVSVWAAALIGAGAGLVSGIALAASFNLAWGIALARLREVIAKR